MTGRRDDQATESHERILRAATALFAARGFYGASTREIAAAAGLNIATVNYHAGGKEALYHAVFQRLFHEEQALVNHFLDQIDDRTIHDRAALRATLEALVDALVDLTGRHPETPRLWMRRWLDGPRGEDGIEAEYALPLFGALAALLARARAAGAIRRDGPDPRLFLISFTWMLYGYFTSGPIDWQTGRHDPLDPNQIAAFKAFLHDYLRRMLEL
jgi:AcrR family transcriptional regulator